ncbi:carotenoid biosynthesis protein [Asanoa sp. NPDC049518]|uniref:carotenoid biosynthesis protein n=1 Tax=unclassified Asanoa TaxID=2685164 RepID=UPI00342EE40E
MTRRLPWYGLGLLILAQICYPLTDGGARAAVTVTTVVVGYVLSVGHAALTRGPRVAAVLVVVTTGGGLFVEAAGVASGAPFGEYTYSGALGPKIAGVPWVIPLAWTWMAWPAWLAAVRLVRQPALRVGVAGVGLAAWDLFLDPQMVGEGYWTWSNPSPSLPGVPDVPLGNYAGWLVVAVLMMTVLSGLAGPAAAVEGRDAPMYALYLWTYFSSILAHAAFLGLPASAGWGALGMGLVAVPLAMSLRVRA